MEWQSQIQAAISCKTESENSHDTAVTRILSIESQRPFNSRWFGGWTGLEKETQINKTFEANMCVQKPFVEETSYLTESLDMDFEHPKSVQYDSSKYWNSLENQNGVEEMSSLSRQMQFDNDLMSPSLSQDQLFSILDFSPDWAYPELETRVLITGTYMGDIKDTHKYRFSCMFGEIEVSAEVLGPGVLRCQAPHHTSGRIPFYVTCSNRLACSEVREFEYRVGLSQEMVAGSNTDNEAIDEMLLQIRFAKSLYMNFDKAQIYFLHDEDGSCNLRDMMCSLTKDEKEDLLADFIDEDSQLPSRGSNPTLKGSTSSRNWKHEEIEGLTEGAIGKGFIPSPLEIPEKQVSQELAGRQREHVSHKVRTGSGPGDQGFIIRNNKERLLKQDLQKSGLSADDGMHLTDILDRLVSLDENEYFSNPLEDSFRPDHSKTIRKLKCFSFMRDKIHSKGYRTWRSFVDDFEDICHYAMKYKERGSIIWTAADTLLDRGKKYLEQYAGRPETFFGLPIETKEDKSTCRLESLSNGYCKVGNMGYQDAECSFSKSNKEITKTVLPVKYNNLPDHKLVKLLRTSDTSVLSGDESLRNVCGSTFPCTQNMVYVEELEEKISNNETILDNTSEATIQADESMVEILKCTGDEIRFTPLEQDTECSSSFGDTDFDRSCVSLPRWMDKYARLIQKLETISIEFFKGIC